MKWCIASWKINVDIYCRLVVFTNLKPLTEETLFYDKLFICLSARVTQSHLFFDNCTCWKVSTSYRTNSQSKNCTSVRTTKKIYQIFVQYHVGIGVFYNLFEPRKPGSLHTPDDATKTLVRAGHVTKIHYSTGLGKGSNYMLPCTSYTFQIKGVRYNGYEG